MSEFDGILPHGARIGILGGGQLGRFLAMAAADLGFSCHVYCPEPDSPAFAVAAEQSCAAYDDEAALARFASGVDVVTYEFENVPARTAAFLDKHVYVRPGVKALHVSQDRLVEKNFINECGIAVAPFRAVDNAEDLQAALGELGAPAILKTRRFGYDGKGQVFVSSQREAEQALEKLGGRDCILEKVIDFDYEISAIIACGVNGAQVSYDPGRNIHKNHILDETFIPSGVAPELERKAVQTGKKIAAALSYTGILSVEMFVCADAPRIIVNEIAPRVHNSGHWTLDGAYASQFEQHIRAIAGWPLRSGGRHSNAVMKNLIGDEVDTLDEYVANPQCGVHLYGKTEARPGRKMGHITVLSPLDIGDEV